MKAFKCDRCGSFYEKYSMTGEVIIMYRNNYFVDICPACYEELNKWYKNELHGKRKGVENADSN